MVSFLAPCVPLVPRISLSRLCRGCGSAGQAGRPPRGHRQLPFVVGFTAFFVLLGVGAALVGGRHPRRPVRASASRGSCSCVRAGLQGLLPWPERLVGAGLLQEARGRGSRVLLGGAFAVCAAPCIGPVLAGIIVLAGSTDTALQGAVLLAVYSLGLAVPFVLAAAPSLVRCRRSAGSATTTA